MKKIQFPKPELWAELSTRPLLETKNLRNTVEEIFGKVAREGDAALRFYAEKFEGLKQTALKVSEAEISEVELLVGASLKSAINIAKNNIENFHVMQRDVPQKIETAPGVTCWRESRPIERVGLYIPGGTAPLFSTVLMLAVPAQIAGCSEIILCTPAGADGKVNPAVLYAAQLCGVTQIFKVGGAQAIAAMAVGTETIPKVYKIFGPGNQYVTEAKIFVQQKGLAVDLPAGPSELLVIADNSAIPEFIAADLLSQAEHGVDSQVVFLTPDSTMLKFVMEEVSRRVLELPRRDIAERSLQNSLFIQFDSIGECIEFSNLYAPEHLILALCDAECYLPQITTAGSIFLGDFSPESAGDYASGTNHTLPTNGAAHAYSGVSLDSFVKKITVQKLTSAGLETIGPAIEEMAGAEGLIAHKNAVSVRLSSIKKDRTK